MTLRDLLIEIGDGHPFTEFVVDCCDGGIPASLNPLLAAAMERHGFDRVMQPLERGCWLSDFAPCGAACLDCVVYNEAERMAQREDDNAPEQ
jgi:hypothetical protein